MNTNRHPADELGDIRAERMALDAREARVRARVMKLMKAGDHLSGDDYVAKWEVQSWRGQLDARALKRAGLNPDKFRKPTTKVDIIRTVRRSEMGDN